VSSLLIFAIANAHQQLTSTAGTYLSTLMAVRFEYLEARVLYSLAQTGESTAEM
jgi:hypothetical protein